MEQWKWSLKKDGGSVISVCVSFSQGEQGLNGPPGQTGPPGPMVRNQIKNIMEKILF